MTIILHLTANQKKEFELPDEKARKLKEEWEDDKILNSHKFVISDFFSIEKGQIKKIELRKEGEQKEDYYKRINREYEEDVKRIKALPPDKRFHYSYFRYVWWWGLGFRREPTEKEIELAKKYSKMYFEKYPDRTKESEKVWEYMCKKEGIPLPPKNEFIVSDEQGGFKSA